MVTITRENETIVFSMKGYAKVFFDLGPRQDQYILSIDQPLGKGPMPQDLGRSLKFGRAPYY